jgi:cysteine sulfinate desulfinase/cysteine desulfurase-like protein
MGALRISFGPTTTEADIEKTIAAFRKIAARLQRAAA